MANSETTKDTYLPAAWKDVKLSVQTRPILLYIIGVPMENVDSFFQKAPELKEVERIRAVIAKDRHEKTSRIKEYLSKVVDYREVKHTANKIGISDTSLHNIIKGKTTEATYDMIDKIELFLSTIDGLGFEVSLGNQLTVQKHLSNEIQPIVQSLNHISRSLIECSTNLTYIANNLVEKGYFDFQTYEYKEIDGFPTYDELIHSNVILEQDIERINALFSTFIPQFKKHETQNKVK